MPCSTSNEYPLHIFLWVNRNFFYMDTPLILSFEPSAELQIKGDIHIVFFLISTWKYMLWVLIRSNSPGASNEYPQHVFMEKKEKYQGPVVQN